MPMGIKFNWEFNVGTLLTIFTFAIGAVGLYVTISEKLTRHEMRITAIELRGDNRPQVTDHEARIRAIENLAITARTERLTFQNEVMQILVGIREDISALKALREMDNGVGGGK